MALPKATTSNDVFNKMFGTTSLQNQLKTQKEIADNSPPLSSEKASSSLDSISLLKFMNMLQSDDANLPLRKYLFTADFLFDDTVYSMADSTPNAYEIYKKINANQTINDYMNFMVRKINMGDGMVLQNVGGQGEVSSMMQTPYGHIMLPGNGALVPGISPRVLITFLDTQFLLYEKFFAEWLKETSTATWKYANAPYLKGTLEVHVYSVNISSGKFNQQKNRLITYKFHNLFPMQVNLPQFDQSNADASTFERDVSFIYSWMSININDKVNISNYMPTPQYIDTYQTINNVEADIQKRAKSLEKQKQVAAFEARF